VTCTLIYPLTCTLSVRSFIDELIPMTFYDMVHLASFLSAVLVSVAIVSPWMIFFLVAFTIGCAQLRAFYMKGSRQLKRLEANSRSPVFSLFGECLNGLPSIRCTTLHSCSPLTVASTA
jgi:hypothetical protein